VTSGIKDIKEAVEKARVRKAKGIRTILFVDEIHRFNKSQQDALLPHVEDGSVILIGATTENPSFSLNSALLSRVIVYRLEAHSVEHLLTILKKSATDTAVGDDWLLSIAQAADGDARRALGIFERLLILNAPTNLMRSFGYGEGYRYAHDQAEGSAFMSNLPTALDQRTYYNTKDSGLEKQIKASVQMTRSRRRT
jgi:replication-associated recombination protein RarA